MKVLFVTGLTGFGLGGARTEEIQLVQGAARRGLDVAMCSDVLAPELLGTTHYRLDYPPGDQAPAQLSAALTAFHPDVVHVVGGGVRFLEVCAKQLAAVPWLFTAHNVPPAERILARLHGNETLHYAARDLLALPSVFAWGKFLKSAGFCRVICHSQTVARRLKAVGCPADRIVQIPFGSELPAEALAPDAQIAPAFSQNDFPRIVTVAGLAHHKGQLDAVRMAARLRPEFPRLRYRLIGMTRDKTFRAYLEKAIASLGLADHVSIMHSVSEAVKFSALREADLYVQPSHEEGFCIAFLEGAMLCPRLIGADTGAIAAMAEGDATARVVGPRDPAALAAAARELLAMQTAPETIAVRRARLAHRYSWQAYLDAHVAVFSDVRSGGAS